MYIRNKNGVCYIQRVQSNNNKVLYHFYFYFKQHTTFLQSVARRNGCFDLLLFQKYTHNAYYLHKLKYTLFFYDVSSDLLYKSHNKNWKFIISLLTLSYSNLLNFNIPMCFLVIKYQGLYSEFVSRSIFQDVEFGKLILQNLFDSILCSKFVHLNAVFLSRCF